MLYWIMEEIQIKDIMEVLKQQKWKIPRQTEEEIITDEKIDYYEIYFIMNYWKIHLFNHTT